MSDSQTSQEEGANPPAEAVDVPVDADGDVPIDGTIGADFLSEDTGVAGDITDPHEAEQKVDSSAMKAAQEQLSKKDDTQPTDDSPPVKVDDKGEEKVDSSSEEMIVGDDGVKRPRYAHFQRGEQLQKNRADAAEARERSLQSVQPIQQYIQNNPDLLKIVDAHMKGQPLQPADEANKLPDKPPAPVQPDGFTLDDALNDPQSASAAYFLESTAYPARLESWRELKEIHDNNVADEDAFVERQNTIQQNIQTGLLAEIQKNPATKDLDHNATLKKVNAFFADRDSLTPGVLVETYLTSTRTMTPEEAISETNTEAQRRATALRDQAAKKSAPIPPAVVTDASVETAVTPDQQYAQSVEDNILAPDPF